MKRAFCLLLAAVMVASCMVGCSRGQEHINIVYPFNADVNSYDPQVAATGDEYLIIENTFEGLVRVDADGRIVKGVADSWSISDDGKVYTFHIKKGLKWNINTDKDDAGNYKDVRLDMMGGEFNPDITADDFVFALRRAAMPQTGSPLFSSISCIKNATNVHKGKAEASALGVTATDTYTLRIELEKRDDSFMQVLSSAVAMPCNEQFFRATNGRYGLDTKYTLFNGQFYLKQILESSYLLKRNDYYGGDNPTKVNELALKILNDDNKDETITRLESGYYDAAFISGDNIDILKKKNMQHQPYIDTMWAFLINTNNEYLSSTAARKAFCLGFTRLEDNEDEHLSVATNVLPPSCMIGSKAAIDAVGDTCLRQDIAESVRSWDSMISQLDTTAINITVITDEYMEQYAKQMLQGIQEGLGTSLKNKNGDTIDLALKVESMTDDELKSRVTSGNYDIALYPFKADSQSATSYLQSFADNDLTGSDTAALQTALNSANDSRTPSAAAKYIRKAEKSIIYNYSICPMLYETSYYVCAKGVDGIVFHPGTGRVNFVNTVRND